MTEVEALLNRARKTVDEAHLLFDADYFEASVSRTYYATFYAAEAALLSEGITPKTHKGTRAMFGKHFVKTKDLPAWTAQVLHQAFETRLLADYGTTPSILQEEARQGLEEAERFVEAVGQLLAA